MGHGKAAACKFGEHRLDVPERRTTGRRVAYMTDCRVALEALDHVLAREMVANQPHRLVRMKMIAIVSDNPGSFLPPMLQGMQAQGGMRRRLPVAENTEHTTFFMEFVVI